MGAGRAISLTLSGEAGRGAWAGDPLSPTGAAGAGAGGAGDAAARTAGTLGILTSGTTGAPKTVLRSVPEALAAKRGGGGGERWLLTFAPWRWAGISVLLHTIRFDGELIVPASPDAADLLAAAAGTGGSGVGRGAPKPPLT